MVSSVQLLGRVRLFAAPRTAARQDSLSITNSQNLLTHVHAVSDVIQPSHPLLSPSPPAFNLSQHPSWMVKTCYNLSSLILLIFLEFYNVHLKYLWSCYMGDSINLW